MTFSERAQFILKNNPCSFRTSGFGTACQTILLAQTDSRRSRCRDSAICLAFFIRCLSAIAVIAQRRFTSRERQNHEEDRKSQTGSSPKAKPSQIRVWNERDNAMCEAYLSALGLFSSHRHQFPDDSGNLPRKNLRSDAPAKALKARNWNGIVVRGLRGPCDISFAEVTRIIGE